MKDLQKYIFLLFSFHIKLLHHFTASCLHYRLMCFHSCPTAPAPRLCPTASASPPSSARTRRPPFTTPPGCSSSRSGSGPASPPSSRRPKSSPQSVPLIFLISPFCHPQLSTLLFVPDLQFYHFLSTSLLWPHHS